MKAAARWRRENSIVIDWSQAIQLNIFVSVLRQAESRTASPSFQQ